MELRASPSSASPSGFQCAPLTSSTAFCLPTRTPWPPDRDLRSRPSGSDRLLRLSSTWMGLLLCSRLVLRVAVASPPRKPFRSCITCINPVSLVSRGRCSSDASTRQSLLSLSWGLTEVSSLRTQLFSLSLSLLTLTFFWEFWV